MNTVIYARYSSSSQREESIEGQIDACKKYAAQNGMTIINEYIDRAASARNDNRPQFQKMIEDSDSGQFEIVLVYQFDRFARNRLDSILNKRTLMENGVRVISATEPISDDPEGKMLEGFLELISEYYSADLARKIRRGLKVNAEKAIYNGGSIPLGYRIDENRKFQIDPVTAPIVVRVFERYANGDQIIDIIDELNQNCITNTRGTKFNKNSFQNLLRNKRYCGFYINGDIEIADENLRIIDDGLFETAQQRKDKQSVVPASKDKYLLTGKLYCGHCENMMVGVSGTSRNGSTYNYYKCKTSASNCKKPIRKESFEDLIVNRCREILIDEKIREIVPLIAALSENSQNSPYIASLKKGLASAKSAIERLLVALETGQEADLIMDRISNHRRDIESFETQLAKENLNTQGLTEPEIMFFLTNLRSGNINSVKYRKALIALFINRIYVYDDRYTIFFNTKDEPVEITSEIIELSKNPSPDLYSNPCPIGTQSVLSQQLNFAASGDKISGTGDPPPGSYSVYSAVPRQVDRL